MKKPSVFLSHSSKDKPLARRIAENLIQNNIDVWLDEWELLVGDSIVQKIQHGLDNTEFVAILLTANSLESGWVEKEWMSKFSQEASTRDIVILPLKADNLPLPTLLRDKKYADFSASFEVGANDLVSAVKGHIFRKRGSGLNLHCQDSKEATSSQFVKVTAALKDSVQRKNKVLFLTIFVLIVVVGSLVVMERKPLHDHLVSIPEPQSPNPVTSIQSQLDSTISDAVPSVSNKFDNKLLFPNRKSSAGKSIINRTQLKDTKVSSTLTYSNVVKGFINNGTVWSIEYSPINIVGDLKIGGLTIEQGVEIHITGNYKIEVSGVIHSLGSEELPVVFKPSDDNTTGWQGIYFEDTVSGSQFSWTRIEGANSSGVHIVRSNPSFDHVTFQGNSAVYGGAIRAEIFNNDLRITNSLFIDNYASTAGGAIYAVMPTGPDDPVLEVTGSVFRRNNVGNISDTYNNTSGGAIYVEGNSIITGSKFIENEAQAYTVYARDGRYARGGAVYIDKGFSEIKATTFMGNACRMGAHYQSPDKSCAYGGAVYLASGTIILSNDLLVNNELEGGRYPDHRGSGVFIASGNCTIVNSTLVHNNTHAVYRSGGQVEILNSILFFNNSGKEQVSGPVLATYSDIQNGFSGQRNMSYNPILNDKFQPGEGSPCIDSGTSRGAPNFDIEGKYRPQGKGYDIGAHEFSIIKPNLQK